jgi:hypothetical protein
MALGRDDRYLTDAQGRALAGAQVYYCLQPANTSSLPPSPLASVYTDTGGDAGTNPVITDGFGHSVAYLDNSQLYTVVLVHPLFGPNPIILPDQAIGLGGGSASLLPFAGIPAGTINGTNTVFTLTNGGVPLTVAPTPSTVIAWLNFPLINGLGYSISGVTITYATAPQPASGGSPADSIFAQGYMP